MNRWLATGAGAIVGVMLVVVLVSLPAPASFGLPAPLNVTLPASPTYKALSVGSWNDFYPAWSPDGSLIAYQSDRGGTMGIWLMKADGTGAHLLSESGLYSAYPTWSPDSKSLAYWTFDGSVGRFMMVEVSTGKKTTFAGQGQTAVPGPARWSPEGGRLLYFVRASVDQLAVADARSGTVTAVANVTGGEYTAAWKNNSSVLFSSISGATWYIFGLDLGTGTLSQFAGDGVWNYTSPTVGSDGTVAYYSNCLTGDYPSYMSFGVGYDAWIVRADGSSAFQFRLVQDHYMNNIFVMAPFLAGLIDVSQVVAFNPNASLIAYAADAPTMGYHLYVWDTTRLTTAPVGPALGLPCDSFQPSWNPTGNLLAFSSNITGFYHIYVTTLVSTGGVASSGGY